MSDLIIAERSDIVAIADAVRNKTGKTEELTLGGIVSGINNIGNSGSVKPTLQNKTVSPTTQSQTIIADSGYDGLSQVTIEPIPNSYIQPSGTLNITSNGTYDVKNYASALVGVESSGGESSSGSLPSGISAITTGTFTPTQDYSSSVNVEHGLGVTPNFFFWTVETALASNAVYSLNIGGAVLRKVTRINSSSTYNVIFFYRGYNSTGIMGGAQSGTNASYLTETTCRICCNSTYKLLTGHTYRWVAGVLDGIE